MIRFSAIFLAIDLPELSTGKLGLDRSSTYFNWVLRTDCSKVWPRLAYVAQMDQRTQFCTPSMDGFLITLLAGLGEGSHSHLSCL